LPVTKKKFISTGFFFHRNKFKLFPLTEVVIIANEAGSFITHYIKKIHVIPFLLKCMSIFQLLFSSLWKRTLWN